MAGSIASHIAHTPSPLGAAAWAFPIAAGLASSFTHCAGMCGPLHMFLATRARSRLPMLRYHAGRVAGYSALGATAGALGMGAGLLDGAGGVGAAYAFGLLYLLFGLQIVLGRGKLERAAGRLFPVRLHARLAGMAGEGRWLFPAGLAASLLPCPTTLAVLVWSAGWRHPVLSGAGMALMGLATAPSFLLLSHRRVRGLAGGARLQSALGVFLVAAGAWRLASAAVWGTAACH